jgi:hypothetical protein
VAGNGICLGVFAHLDSMRDLFRRGCLTERAWRYRLVPGWLDFWANGLDFSCWPS